MKQHSVLDTLSLWHKTVAGRLGFGVIELGAVYGLATLALATGSGWWYIGTAVFLYGALHNIFGAISKVIRT